MAGLFGVAVLTIVSAGSSATGTAAPPAVEAPAAPDSLGPTQVDMRSVDFYVDRDIPLRVRRLTGTITSKAGGPVMFDDKRSFVIGVTSAEVGLTGKDLSLLLNRYVFNYAGSPLRNLSITTSGSEIVQKGTLHKVFPMPFEIRARLSVTPDGRIRMRPVRTEILGLHVDKLMQGLGLALDEVINLKKSKGASVSGNDIFISPTIILPPPAIEGRLTAIRVEGNEVVQTFGTGQVPAVALPDTAIHSYMYYRGGTLRFGKLVMVDADMLITELDPADPFRFNIDEYQRQLVAGYSKSTVAGGLIVYMKDVDKLKRP